MNKSCLRHEAALLVTIPLVLALVLVFTASCGPQSFKPSIQKALSKELDGWMEHLGIPGAVVGIWAPGQGQWVAARGKAYIAGNEPMKTNLRFRIGSITKTFTATVILTLVDEGKLTLDDKVSKYVSGVPEGDRITVRMLCNNTSGLFNYGEDPAFVENLVADPQKKYTPRELVDFAASRPAYFEPGKGFHYSNTNFILQGMIIEEITGRPVAEAYNKRIIEPLGLKNTYFAEGTALESPYSHGYGEAEDGSGKLEDYTNWLDMSVDWTAGAMVSDLYDLKTWAKAFSMGRLLNPSSHEEQMKGVSMPGSGGYSKYGLGMFTMGAFNGHDGMLPGYNAAMFYEPSSDTTYVVLFNKSQAESIALAAFMGLTKAAGTKVPW
ncbi:MAG: serine hydrolase domain-containing protein [Candidatus Geothermincolia bacterium]